MESPHKSLPRMESPMYLSIGQTFILLSLSESDIIQYLMSLSGCTKLLAAVDSRRMRATGRRERAAAAAAAPLPQTLRPGAAAGRTGPLVQPHPRFSSWWDGYCP